MNNNVGGHMPDLSVIVPAYNASKTIARTLNSLTNQTVGFEYYEIIVIDDGSVDDTLEICNKFADIFRNVRVIYQPNGGVSSARNAGLSVAKGRWITFVDSDDYVTNNYVEVIISTHPETDLIVFDNFLERGGICYNEKNWLKPWFGQFINVQMLWVWICETRLNSPWDKRFSAELIRNNGLLFEYGVNMAEDLLFNFAYAMCVDKIFVSEKSINIHTQNPEGLCYRPVTEHRMREYELVYFHMLKMCEDKIIKKKLEAKINTSFLRMIHRYAAQLIRAGYCPVQIKEIFGNSVMVKRSLWQIQLLPKDMIRKWLLKLQLYRICAMIVKHG